MLVFSVLIISRLDSQGKFQIFTLFSGHHIGVPRRYTNMDGVFILGSVNFCEAFRRLEKRTGPGAHLTGLKLGEVSYLCILYNITIS